MTSHEKAVETVARAIYDALPNFSMQWRPHTAGGHSQHRVDEPYGIDRVRASQCEAQARAAISAYLASMRERGWEMVQQVREEFPPLDEAFDAALKAARVYADAANDEECKWTGWGDQVVPPYAEMRRAKAEQALAALRDSDPRRVKVAVIRAPLQPKDDNLALDLLRHHVDKVLGESEQTYLDWLAAQAGL